MANKAGCLILLRSMSTIRWLSTSTEKGTTLSKQKGETLYRKLSALRDSDANITDALDEWVKEGNSVQRYYIISYARHLRKTGKYLQAIQLYEWMEKSKNKMNNADRAICIDLLAKTGGVTSAEKYFNTLKETAKTKKTYGALLNCYCTEKMLDKALELFEKMKELDFTSTLNYNNMMKLNLSVGQSEKIPLLVQEMEEKNVASDLYTYNNLMNSYASLEDINAVEGVLEKMKTKKVEDNWFTYGNLATIYVNAGLVDKAHAVLGKMEKMKNLHDREAFHTIITLYGKTSNLSGCYRVWESLKLTIPKPSNVSYLMMLLALSKLGDVDTLEKCYREWESDCSNYDVRLSNVILESYLNRNMISEADLIYENILKGGAEPNLRTLELFTNFHIKNRQIDLAQKYLEMGASKANPERHKWFPTDDTIRMFLKYFEEENVLGRAEKFCKTMKMLGRLDSAVYDSLLHA